MYMKSVRNGPNMTSWIWSMLAGIKPNPKQSVAYVLDAIQNKPSDKSCGGPQL